MRYVAIWFGVFATATLGAIIVVGVVWLTQEVVSRSLWWIPAGLFIAVMLATLAVSLEVLTDNGEAEE